METLVSHSPLPELSFDDLLVDSPSAANRSVEEDPLDIGDTQERPLDDDSLHTPGPKSRQRPSVSSDADTATTMTEGVDIAIETNSEEEATRPLTATTTIVQEEKPRILSTVTIVPAKVMASTTTTTTTATAMATATTSSSLSSTTSPAPVILNGKNVLPKTARPAQYVKIPVKSSNNASGSGGGSASGPILTMINGKTAIKTANGQIIYIQKAGGNLPPVRLQASAASTAGLASSVATTATATMSRAGITSVASSGMGLSNAPTSAISLPGKMLGGNKTVVIRSADGKLVPLKASAAAPTGAAAVTAISSAMPSGSNVSAKNPLTLSPTVVTAAQLSGKKIVTCVGGNKMVFKATTIPSAGGSQMTQSPTVTPMKPVVAITATMETGAGKGVAAMTVKNIGCKSEEIKSLASTTTTTTTTATTATGTAITMKPSTAVSTLISSPTSGGKFVVQTENGKKICVSNPNLLKIFPKSQSTGSTVHLSGKPGVQYVRVISGGGTYTAVGGEGTASSSSSEAHSKSPGATATRVKVLNSLQHKLQVIQPNSQTTTMTMTATSTATATTTLTSTTGTTAKFVLTPSTRKDGSNGGGSGAAGASGSGSTYTFSPVTSKVKTVVSVPNSAARALILDGGAATSSSNTSGGSSVMQQKQPSAGSGLTLIQKKIKISDLNLEGSTDRTLHLESIKTTPNGGRVVVMSRKMVKGPVGGLGKVMATVGGVQGTSVKVDEGVQKKYYSVLKAGKKVTTSAIKSVVKSTQAHIVIKEKQSQSQHDQQQKQEYQEQQQESSEKYSGPVSVLTSDCTILPLKMKEEPQVDDDVPDIKPSIAVDEGLIGGVRRKHCNCSKSQCLKLYCDCFANGEFCQDCTCKDCFNNLQYEDERQRAIKNCLERNPSAFKPKITTARDMGDMRLHNKGCNCKRSGCLKNYCECYEAKIPCSSNCKCVGCRNVEDRPDLDLDPIDSKFLAAFSGAAGSLLTGSKRSYDKAFLESTRALGIKTEESDLMGEAALLNDKQAACNFITQEVIDATIQCMISQADECEKNGLSDVQTEKKVMEELGRCLVEIIDFSIRNTDTSFTQD